MLPDEDPAPFTFPVLLFVVILFVAQDAKKKVRMTSLAKANVFMNWIKENANEMSIVLLYFSTARSTTTGK